MRVHIEKLVSKGEGFTHYEGKALFVSGALPGEVVDVAIIEEKRDYSRAEIISIIEPSDARILPACPLYGECGGCDVQHATTQAQLHLKETMVFENLKRIGSLDIDNSKDLHILPAVSDIGWNYRSRVRFHVDMEAKKAGFLSKKSDHLVDVPHCPILCEPLNLLLGEKRNILFQAAQKTVQAEPWQKRNRYTTVPAFLGDSTISLSNKEIPVTVKEKVFYVDSRVFFQSNRLVLPPLIDFVSSSISGNVIVDLYCGVGLFSAFVEGDGRRVIAVEKDIRCQELAKKHLFHSEFITSKTEQWIRKPSSLQAVDTVIVDPPRLGLDMSVIEAIAKWNAKKIVYISCDSVTLSRDCKLLKEKGYTVEKLQIFDFYPQTSHVETGVLLSKADTV